MLDFQEDPEQYLDPDNPRAGMDMPMTGMDS
jgi:hypothetical protein